MSVEIYAVLDAGPNGPDWDIEFSNIERAIAYCEKEVASGRAKYASVEREIRVSPSSYETKEVWRSQ